MRRIAATAVVVLVCAACGGGEQQTGGAVASPPGTAAPATTTVAPTTTSTTSTTTTTLSQGQQDAVAAAALWDGLDAAWREGPEAAARYMEAHTYPGWPAAYENCLRPDVAPGSVGYSADPGTLEPDPGWVSDEVDVAVRGRIYTVELEVRSGTGADAETRTSTAHVAITDGEAYFFFLCEPPLADDALAYRLAEGSQYTHRVTYRADITEDQRPADGRVVTGRETWTITRGFDIGEVSADGVADLDMTVARVVWDMYSDGTHWNAFDTNDDEEQWWYGQQGDLALREFGWGVGPEGPPITEANAFSFLDLPAEVVAEGDSWESAWALNDPDLRGTMTVTVAETSGGVVRVAFEGNGEGFYATDRDFAADYALRTEGAVSGTAVIDAVTGWVRSMDVGIDAAGTIEFTSQGRWDAVRPLAGSVDPETGQSKIAVGVEIPATYEIEIEVSTVEG